MLEEIVHFKEIEVDPSSREWLKGLRWHYQEEKYTPKGLERAEQKKRPKRP